jgi:hypothetical protein
MRARLKATLSNWKSICLTRTKQKRELAARLVRSQERITKLEAEIVRLNAMVAPQAVRTHTYPAQMIAMAVFIVVQAGGSLRCAAKTIAFFSRMMGWHYGQPSPVTIRNWVLRCGLYGYEHVEKVGCYVGIIDESIQIGREKLLLFLGVKLHQDRSHCAPLRMDDVEVLGMEVQQSWTGNAVADFVKECLKHHPKLALQYVISDRGTALLAAFRTLGLVMVSDCSHPMMNVVKKLFATNEPLSDLVGRIGQLRRRLLLTPLGFLLPPTLRDKDRFLRIFTIVDWWDRIEAYWNKLPIESREKLDFLMQARPLLQCLAQIRELIVLTSELLKSAGLSQSTHRRWEERIAKYGEMNPLTHQARAFIVALRKYFDAHAELIAQEQRLLCCSDIIESSFGRYKNKGGMQVISADVLAISLYGHTLTTDFIQQALAKVHQKDVEEWQQLYTCHNQYSTLRRMDRELKSVA